MDAFDSTTPDTVISAPFGAPASPANPPAEGSDVSLAAYLAEDDSTVTGTITISKGRKIKIGVVTELEMEQLQNSATKPDPRAGRGATKFDQVLFRRMLAVKALHKADPSIPEATILANFVGNTRLAGDITAIAEGCAKLSGFDPERSSENDRLLGFSS